MIMEKIVLHAVPLYQSKKLSRCFKLYVPECYEHVHSYKMTLVLSYSTGDEIPLKYHLCCQVLKIKMKYL